MLTLPPCQVRSTVSQDTVAICDDAKADRPQMSECHAVTLIGSPTDSGFPERTASFTDGERTATRR